MLPLKQSRSQLSHKLICLGSVSLSLQAHAAPVEYVIDADHTKVGFEVSHLVVSTVEGNFRKFGGHFSFDPAAPEKTTLEAWAETASVDTGVKKRDEHLRSPDFFDAKKFPKIMFKTKKAEKVSDKTFKLTGDFTLRGVTKEVVFEVTFKGQANAYGKARAAFKGQTSIVRQDFGVSFNDVVESGPVVGNEVTILIQAEGIAKKDL